jgi:tripartite-type tricarboxylate transporter receptor subunit TctC
MPTTRRTLALGSLAALPTLRAAAAQASPWPARPVSIVVAFAAGGAVDTLARLLGQRLSEQTGGTFLVENRVGGGGTVSAAHVARAQPDGHTLLVMTSSHAVNETLASNRGYVLLRDLRPIVQFAATPYWLAVRPDRATSLSELLEKAKREPMTFATGGPGGLTHLLGEMLKQETGLDLTSVHYRGNAPAITDLLAGRVDMIFDNSGTIVEHIKSRRLRGLASTTPGRLGTTPDVPAMAELGFPQFDVSAWIGLAAPAGTPDAVVERIAAEMRQALEDEGFRSRIAGTGAEVAYLGPAEFDALVGREIPRWAQVIQAGGVTVN